MPKRSKKVTIETVIVADPNTPEGADVLLEMTIAYLAGHTGDPATELRHKLDGLTDEERAALIAYLSKPTHEGGRA